MAYVEKCLKALETLELRLGVVLHHSTIIYNSNKIWHMVKSV